MKSPASRTGFRGAVYREVDIRVLAQTLGRRRAKEKRKRDVWKLFQGAPHQRLRAVLIEEEL